jgi:hypothetical protein
MQVPRVRDVMALRAVSPRQIFPAQTFSAIFAVLESAIDFR